MSLLRFLWWSGAVSTTPSSTPPPPDFSGSFIAVPTTERIPASIVFTASISGSVQQILWDFNGDGTFDASTTNATAYFISAGTYSPKMRLIAATGSVVDIVNTDYLILTTMTTGTGNANWRSWRNRLS